MRHGALAVEQSRRRQEEGAAADRCDTLRRRGTLPHPSDQSRIATGGVDAVAARDDQRMQRCAGLGERGRTEFEAGARDDAFLGGDDRDLVGQGPAGEVCKVVSGGEDLQGPGNVEQLPAGEGEDLDATHVWHEARDAWQFGQSFAR